MEGKLIKTSKDSYHNGHYFLNDDNGFAIGSSDKDWCKRAVKKRPLYVLSLTNCQAIERGYDLDELAKIHHKLAYIQAYNPDIAPYVEADYKAGFQKALEILGDKKFTEDDIRKAIKSSRKGFMQQQHNGYGMPTHSMFVLNDLSSDDIIQSLEQTEWDVTFDPEEKDVEGRLILKRK